MKKSILIVSLISYVSLLIQFSVCSQTQPEPVHKVEIISTEILHGYFGYGFPICKDTSPILHIELDIGSMCLYSENTAGGINFTVGADPECSIGDLCAGPSGPISMWTKSRVVKSIINCLSSRLGDGESIEDFTPEEFKEKFNLKKNALRVTTRSGVFEEVKMNLKVEDVNDALKQVLPNEDDVRMEIVYSKHANDEIVLVSVENVLPEPLSFCFAAESTTNQEVANEFFKVCSSAVICSIGEPPQYPGKWTFDELETSVINCLARYHANIDRPLNFKKQKRVSNTENTFSECLKEEL